MARWARVAPVPLLPIALLFLLALWIGCSKKPTGLDGGHWNRAPETELTYAPPQSDTASFSVHLYWNGYDNDGEVVLFRFAIDADTANAASQWNTTTAHDSEFVFAVDPMSHVQGHVFWIVAQDNDGAFDTTPAKRYFSSKTVPPTSRIIRGPLSGSASGSAVTFAWEGSDPDGNPKGWESPAASFEYILLRPGTSASEGHPPLPAALPLMKYYPDLINRSTATSLPAPYDDWTWVSTTETSHRFTDLAQGYYVFAVRAVDRAGARQTNLVDHANIRWFFGGANAPPGPGLIVTSNIFLDPVSNLEDIYYVPRVTSPFVTPIVEILTSQDVTFAWSATTSATGAPVAGYSTALDDTMTTEWSEIDPSKASATLPADLSEGPHFLFIRAVDVDGGASIVVVRLLVVRPAFQGGPPLALWVDDFTAPGGSPLAGAPNYPSDDADDDWWRRVLLQPLSSEFGVTFGEWDTYRRHEGLEGRGKPSLRELAQYRVVIWSVDLNNTTSTPTGLWTTTVGGISSSLANYVRGGGTLIVTGFSLANHVTSPPSMPYMNSSRGLCEAVAPGTAAYRFSYFMRSFMGIDGARPSFEATRTSGGCDFVEARVTTGGQALGFQSAEVDTGGTGSGAKWNPYAFPGFPLNPDISLAPGLPRIEGWKMQSSFACEQQGMRSENPAAPIATPLFTYHGVNRGLLQDKGPSLRENLVIGVATQAHDLGESDGRPVTPGDTRGIMGRMVFLGFPIYYMKDAQAHAVMRAAFAYVNASPTLGGGF